MRIFIFISAYFLFSFNAKCQGIVLNFDLDTTAWNIAEPMQLWIDFLETKNDSLGANFWNSEERGKYGDQNYFALKRELDFGQSDYLNFLGYGNIRVLSVRKRGEYFKISNTLSFTNQEGGEDLYYIFHLYAGYENGELKLFNALKINSRQNLVSKKVGFITYYYPKNHQFDISLAQKQNNFLMDLTSKFDVPVVEVDYYFTETNEEIQRIKGFDFNFGDNGINIPTGISYVLHKEIFTSGAGEYYPHEIIHVLLNPHYLQSHYWINEGVATYFGMSRGKPLDWHLEKLQRHLSEQPEIDLSNMLNLIKIDGSTGYSYVLGGYIVKLIYEKGGFPELKLAMSGGRSEQDFYQMIEDRLNIKKTDINRVFRKQIAELKFD